MKLGVRHGAGMAVVIRSWQGLQHTRAIGSPHGASPGRDRDIVFNRAGKRLAPMACPLLRLVDRARSPAGPEHGGAS